MRKYDCKIAAQKLVQNKTRHGLSRRHQPDLACAIVTSVMTEKAHTQALTTYAKWLHQYRDGKHLKSSTISDASIYLKERATSLKQSTVDLDRQAINLHLHCKNPLSFVASTLPTIPQNRAYSPPQISLLVEMSDANLGQSILLAADSGLRSMELVSIANTDRLTPSLRDWSVHRFAGREGARSFVVHGKGGLIREVKVSQNLAAPLLCLARPQPERVSHRGAHLMSHFDLNAGHRFSLEFGALSKRVLGFSYGAHGLRHSFAQRRRTELLCCGFSLQQSIEILSQELGHFSTANTMAYLRD